MTLFLQNPLIEIFGWTLLHSLWQLALIAAITALILPLLHRASPNTRYVFCTAALALCIALPIATFLRLFPTKQVMPQPPSTVFAFPAQLPITNYQLPDHPTSRSPDSPTPTPASRLQLLLPYAVLAYFAGALFLSFRLFLGYCRLRQLRRTALPAPNHFQSLAATLIRHLAITRPIQILQSALVEVPTVIGHFRPIILLPVTAMTGLTPDQLSALLAHELAHIRRHDYLLNLLQTLIETLLFYHPAVWWLSAKIRQEREHCCDDLALSLAADPITYARALTQMESLRASPALSIAANSTRLLPRIHRILDTKPAPTQQRRFLPLASCILSALFIAALLYMIGCSNLNPSTNTTERTYDLHELLVAKHVPVNEESTKSIAEAIELSIAPATWRDHGGQLGSITYRGEKLIITQTTENQKAISYFIADQIASQREIDLDDPDSPINRAAREHLEKDLKELSCDDQGLEKVINEIRKGAGTNFYVNWAALHETGIERTTPVTLHLKRVPFGKVLTTVLSEVDGGKASLGFDIEDGVITISTRKELELHQYQVVRVFDIRDMLVQPDNNLAPPFGNVDHPATAPAKPLTRDQILKQIIETIQSTIEPDSWHNKGGQIGSIRELNGQLIVNQTISNQKAVYQLLQQLREARVQIAVETHFLLVDDATFKKFNLPGQFDGTIITNMQLNDLLMAEQSSPNTAKLDPPRITLFSGQRGYVAFTEQQNYIAACQAHTNDKGKLVPDYDIQTFSGGLVLMIEGTTSRDRRYVVLKTNYALRHLEKMDTLPAPGMPASQEFIVQKPIFTEHLSPQVMCSVPDGGTIVLNGPKLPNFPSEIKNQNVPHLTDLRPANAPATDRHLIVLIRPRLVVQQYIETQIKKDAGEIKVPYDQRQSVPPTTLPNPNAAVKAIPDDPESDTTYINRPQWLPKNLSGAPTK